MDDLSPAPKLLGRASVRLRLAAASIVVLVTGAWLAPEQRPADTAAAEERPAPLLEEQVQRRAPAALVAGVQSIAAVARPYSVAILPAPERLTILSDHDTWFTRAPQPAGFGAIVSPDGGVLTHASALGGRTSVRVQRQDGADVEATVAAYDPDSGAVLLRLASTAALPVSPMTTTLPQPGSLAAAVATWNGQPNIAPVFVLEVSDGGYRITASSGLRPGTPLFSPDGQLLAITADAGRGHAVAAASAFTRLTQLAAAGQARASLGMSVQAVSDALAVVFGAGGVIVADVAPGFPAATAGLEPGDVVLTIADRAVATPDDAMAAIASLRADVPVAISITRDRKPQTLNITPASAYVVDTNARTRRDNLRSLTAVDVLSSEQMTAAGLSPDAAILRINNRPVVSRADADRELRRGAGPHAVYLEDGARRFFAVVGEAQ